MIGLKPHQVRHLLEASAIALASPALAQEAPRSPPVPGSTTVETRRAATTSGMQTEPLGAGDIIVTAQKRAESVNKVPMSITAQSGDQLTRQGVLTAADLSKIVPGFQYTPSLFGEPVFTLRGIGFYDTSIGGRPAVTVYVDEVPLPFSVMSGFGSLDLERVEVLKGPQGTIFGQNSTGGAINYIAAKPTRTPRAGLDISYGRFDDLEATAYAGGPLSSTLGARVAVQTSQAGAWQRSYTSDRRLGKKDRLSGRLLLDWHPGDSVRFALNLNGGYNHSDSPAAQKIGYAPNDPTVSLPTVSSYPNAPARNRAADWTPGFDYGHNERQLQAALRGEIDLSDDVTFTSITSYADWHDRYRIDIDGEALSNVAIIVRGKIGTFYQEARLSGVTEGLKWLVGGTYEHDRTKEDNFEENVLSTVTPTFLPLNGGLPFLGNPYFTHVSYRTYAAFGNVDYDLGERITLHAGVRYTKMNSHGTGASLDSPNGALGLGLNTLFNLFRGGAGLPAVPYVRGGPVTGDEQFRQVISRQELDEDNVSWRAGADFKVSRGTLLYANVSRGYKAGSYPVLEATLTRQLQPVKQESVTAYEIGFKTALLDRTLQANGALFYYDYRDKQFIGRVSIPPLGSQQTIVNVPKSRVRGAEILLTWQPSTQFLGTIGASYLDTRISAYSNFDGLGNPAVLTGESFPYAPDYQVSADGEYNAPVGERLKAFVGATGHYQSRTTGAFGENAILTIKPYATLDLRAGIESTSGVWRASVFGRNVTGTYYWQNAQKALDTVIRYAGMPTTYGLSLSIKYR